MRRFVAWVGGAAGGIAAYRLLRRHPEAAPEPEPAAPDADDRAEELRTKLAESRESAPVVEEPSAEPVAEEESAEPQATDPDSPEERRRRVHEEGRSALDEMKPE